MAPLPPGRRAGRRIADRRALGCWRSTRSLTLAHSRRNDGPLPQPDRNARRSRAELDRSHRVAAEHGAHEVGGRRRSGSSWGAKGPLRRKRPSRLGAKVRVLPLPGRLARTPGEHALGSALRDRAACPPPSSWPAWSSAQVRRRAQARDARVRAGAECTRTESRRTSSPRAAPPAGRPGRLARPRLHRRAPGDGARPADRRLAPGRAHRDLEERGRRHRAGPRSLRCDGRLQRDRHEALRPRGAADSDLDPGSPVFRRWRRRCSGWGSWRRTRAGRGRRSFSKRPRGSSRRWDRTRCASTSSEGERTRPKTPNFSRGRAGE